MLRVLIADDHEIVRRGVRDVVTNQPGWEVCGEASEGSEVLALAQAQQPNVVVLDVSMPGLNGMAVTRQIRQLLPATEVLLFTMHDDDETVAGGGWRPAPAAIF
jgi:DNA-binding NarL/FixJ family response regulator